MVTDHCSLITGKARTPAFAGAPNTFEERGWGDAIMLIITPLVESARVFFVTPTSILDSQTNKESTYAMP